MKKREPKDCAIYIRVTKATKQKFEEMAARFGTPSEVLRELIEGFIEGRVTIAPPQDKESLYVTRNEN